MKVMATLLVTEPKIGCVNLCDGLVFPTLTLQNLSLSEVKTEVNNQKNTH
jgi:hypothetical protein